MREITSAEVQGLKECLESLAEHHNEVSTDFGGSYPSRPYEETLELFEQALTSGTSRIAVAEDRGCIIGFCKIDICAENGKLDYLVVKKAYRGKGCGKLLMDWAMQTFESCNVRHIEVKVVAGNDAIHLYEKYGFKVNAHILALNR